MLPSRLAAFAAVCFLGCTVAAAEVQLAYGSEEMGLAHYFPKAKLKLEELSPRKYLASLYPGERALRPSGQDAFLVAPFYAVVAYCPAWRLTKAVGGNVAVIRFVPERAGAGVVQYQIELLDEPPAMGVSVGDSTEFIRTEIIDFTGTDWPLVREQWCDNPSRLNRQW